MYIRFVRPRDRCATTWINRRPHERVAIATCGAQTLFDDETPVFAP